MHEITIIARRIVVIKRCSNIGPRQSSLSSMHVANQSSINQFL